MPNETYAAPWARLAEKWRRHYTPPGGPSPEAIAAYRIFIRQTALKSPRVLIQGATPELRDLCAEMGFETVFIDVSKEMIEAMTILVRAPNPKETGVHGDWTQMPFADDSFDLLLGDVTLQNVPHEFQTRFLEEAQRVLRPGGYWITKMLVQPDGWRYETFEQTVERYKNAPESRYLTMEFLFVLLHNAYDKRTRTNSMRRVREVMRRFETSPGVFSHPDPGISRMFTEIWEMWRPMDKEWCICSERELQARIAPYFELLEKRGLEDCFDEMVDRTVPIWCCRVKKAILKNKNP